MHCFHRVLARQRRNRSNRTDERITLTEHGLIKKRIRTVRYVRTIILYPSIPSIAPCYYAMMKEWIEPTNALLALALTEHELIKKAFPICCGDWLFPLFNMLQDKTIYLVWQGSETKKRFASLRFCVSSLHRDHANLLCIVKRLFNARAETRATNTTLFEYINQKALSTTERVLGLNCQMPVSSIKEKPISSHQASGTSHKKHNKHIKQPIHYRLD